MGYSSKRVATVGRCGRAEGQNDTLAARFRFSGRRRGARPAAHRQIAQFEALACAAVRD